MVDPKDELKNEANPKVVQTYAEDMAKVIEGGTGGLIKKVIHGEEEHEREKQNLSPQSRKNKLFMYFSFAFLLSAFVVMLIFYWSSERLTTVPIEKQFVPLLFHDQNSFLEVRDLKKEEIATSFVKAVAVSKLKRGGVEGIYLAENKKVIGLRRFLALIKSELTITNPDSVSDQYLLGFVNNESEALVLPDEPTSPPSKDFFMVMKVRSMSEVFNDIRAWEQKMFFDLYGFLGVDLNASSTYLLTKDFEDGIVGNKNARILRSDDGRIVIMYIFVDEESVIITNTEKAASELILRLTNKAD